MNQKLATLLTSLTLAYSAQSFAMPTYAPIGPQNNVAIATVAGGGWSLCFSEAYGNSGTPIASATSTCTGDLMMLAGGVNGSADLSVLAWAPTADVMFATGGSATPNTSHNANGSEWYFDPSWSWGFAPAGSPINLDSCDTIASTSLGIPDATTPQRLCWHTGGGDLTGGWRVGAADFLNSEPSGYTRYIYTANSVPEPGSLALLGLGVLGFAAARRRNKR